MTVFPFFLEAFMSPSTGAKIDRCLRLARGHVCDRDLEALVRGHLEYIRNYVYRYGSRDRAHFEWTYDKVGWLRRRLHRDEIRLLDSIIQGD